MTVGRGRCWAPARMADLSLRVPPPGDALAGDKPMEIRPSWGVLGGRLSDDSIY